MLMATIYLTTLGKEGLKEVAMQSALSELASLPVVKEVGSFVRVED